MPQKLLVTGASGNLGKLVLDALLKRGVAASDIIATTRDATKLADYAAKGIEVREADFNDPASVRKAFTGADRVAIISTDAIDGNGTRIKQQTGAVAAAKEAGVKHIVYTSMPNPHLGSKVTFEADHRLTEEAVKTSGLTYTIVRNSWYQENLFMNLPQVLASGTWYTSAGQGKVSHIARQDCADALAAALASENTQSKIYTLTGLESFTTDEIARLASEVTGKPISVVHLTDEQLAGGMKAAGVPDYMVPFLIGLDANTREGGADLVNSEVESLIGRKPRHLRAFFEENKTRLAG
jgi:NAD(P)H dehydrogenase (quinone)